MADFTFTKAMINKKNRIWKASLASDEYYALWTLLSQARDTIWKARERELARYGIPASQARVLFSIEVIDEPVTPAKISRLLFRESQSISGILTRMEERGLIKRVKDLDRKNQVRIVITEKGRQAYHQSVNKKAIQRIMSSLTKGERQQLKSYLQTLRDKALKEQVMLELE